VRDVLVSTALFIAAIPAGVAPRRYWRELDVYLPISRAALLSAIGTVFLGAAIGIPAYLHYAQASASAAVDMMLQATGWKPVPAGGTASVTGAQLTWVASSMSLAAFWISTPAGISSVYLTVTGWIRIIAWYVDDAWGDPILTIADGLARRSWMRRRDRNAQAAREKREGPEVPDILVTGATAGFPDTDLVVIASRRKPEWDAGAIVVTDDKWFKLGVAAERDMPGGLRTLYPLTELHHHEVLRRAVQYTLPPLKGRR
jgi:hypothetical protein